MLYRLIQFPDVMARLRADAGLLDVAIEEALRFDSPVQGLFRTSRADTETLGEAIPARTKMQLLYASANRDAAHWDAPDEFRLDRDVDQLRQHLAFGWGIHLCIGAPLARLEARITFERVLGRMGDIELAGKVQRNDSYVLRGLTTLPIRWTPIG
jgi:cytochrome P450